MPIEEVQRLVRWLPSVEVAERTPSFGDIEIVSLDYCTLRLSLPYEEGKLLLQFNDARAFMTEWDGDPNPFLNFREAGNRTGDLFKVERSRWLASGHFNLGIEPSRTSDQPWEHFLILASERSIHVAARENISIEWAPGTWSGEPGGWTFMPLPATQSR